MFCLQAVLLLGVTVYTALTREEYSFACVTPGWMVMTRCGSSCEESAGCVCVLGSGVEGSFLSCLEQPLWRCLVC